MPTTNRVAAAHQRLFREYGILPRHARYAETSYQGDNAHVCVLCGNTNLVYRYQLKFIIPSDDDPERERVSVGNADPRNPLITNRRGRNETRRVTFKSVGSECIYNWAAYLRETARNNRERAAIDEFETNVVEVVRANERTLSRGRTVTARLARINAFFDGAEREVQRENSVELQFMEPDPAGRIMAGYYDSEVRERWATTFGDTGIDRLLETVAVIGRHYIAEGSDPANIGTGALTMRTFFSRFNPRTMRENRRRGRRMLCTVCGAGMPSTGRSYSSRRRVLGTCEFCGRSNVDAAVNAATQTHTDTGGSATMNDVGESARVADAVDRVVEVNPDANPPITEFDHATLSSHPRWDRLSVEDRQAILNVTAAIPNMNQRTREMVVDIVRRAFQYRTLTGPQQTLLERLARENAPTARDLRDDASTESGAPRCPVHNLTMRERTGPFGRFYGCPQYPECRITVNIAEDNPGLFRGVPVAHGPYVDTDNRTRVGSASGRGRRTDAAPTARAETPTEPSAENTTPARPTSGRAEGAFGRTLRATIREKLGLGVG